MKKRLFGLGTIIKRTFKGWNEDDPFRQSAAIAYYAVFSLPALLILIINVAGFFFGKKEVSDEISRQVEDAMGADTAEQIEKILEKASETKAGVVSSIIAVITIIFGATGVFMQLQKSLNRIWDVKENEKQGFKQQIRHRLFSFGLIVCIGFLLLVSLVISTALSAFNHWLEARFPDIVANLFYVVDIVISIGVITTLFALMFKILPDVRQGWRYIWPGALVTGLLFTLGKYGLSLYFGKAEPASVYGAAGSIVLILLWASYSSMIVFFGAEFTKQYELFYGIKPEPSTSAVKIIASDVTVSKDGKISGEGIVSQDVKELLDETTNNKNGHNENGHLHTKDTELIRNTIKKNGTMKHKEKVSGDESFLHKELSVMNEEIRYKDENKTPQITQKLDKYRKRKLKSKNDLQYEINRMELRLGDDIEGMEDNLKGPLLGGLIPRILGIEKDIDRRAILDEYLIGIAMQRYKSKPEGWTDKVARLAEFLKTEFK